MKLFTRGFLIILFLSLTTLTYAQRTYYVSNSGSDSNSGSEAQPWKSVAKVNQTNFSPGDKILFKRGGSWDQEILPRSSGSSSKPIVFGAYGSGSKPIIAPRSGSYGINVRVKSYIHVENLHVVTPPGGNGIAFRGDSRGCVARDCYVEGNKANNSRAGIAFSSTLDGKYGTNNKVFGNEIVNCFEGILGNGGMHDGGLVENNFIHDMRPGGEDGIVAKRGNYEGLIIRNNEITRWRDDGIDLFDGVNVIVEYNRVHDVASQLNGSGNCIKAGGSGSKSEGCIIRYNTVYNNVSGSGGGVRNGISSNAGDKMKIYGNLIYNVQGEAIAIPVGSQDIEIYHNTAISSSKEALYVAGKNVVIKNNILWGSNRPLNINTSVKGYNNVFINGANQSNYSGSNDIKASASAVFADPSKRDYQLKSGSPAIDKGTQIAGYTSTIRKRSIKGNPDIGVYEYGGSTATPSPVASLQVDAGSDVTITLPVSRASFQAQASGTNGATVSYRWTKKSGPSITLSNASSSKLDLQNAQQGTYVLSVTASANGSSSSDEVQLVVKPASDKNPPAPAPSPSPAPPVSNKNGLQYKYYEGSWSALPNFASQTVRKQGTVSNLDVGVRRQDSNFGLVFTGNIQINSSGQYTFYTTSDDGSKLFIDGKLVVNNDGLHAARERSGKVSLSKGMHSIEVQFFERSGKQVLEARYAGPGVSKQRIPNGVLYPNGSTAPTPPSSPEPAPKPSPNPPTAGNNGLRYKYYEGSWPYLPNFANQRVIKQGTVTNFDIGVRLKDDRFGIVYNGSIQINTSGTYTFYTTSDDGSKLFIDGKEVVDNDGNHPAQERSGKVSLSKGFHTIEVQFIERTVGEVLNVHYQGPGISKQKIPNNVLFLNSPSNARVASSTSKPSLNLDTDNNQMLDLTQVNVYPVPFGDQLTVDFGGAVTKQTVRVALIDHLGRVVLERAVLPSQGQALVLDLSNLGLSRGMYHVSVAAEGQLPRSIKVIKQ